MAATGEAEERSIHTYRVTHGYSSRATSLLTLIQYLCLGIFQGLSLDRPLN